jgi:hypothetical protein
MFLRRGEFVAHEVLEDRADPTAQLGYRQVAEVDAVPADLPSGRVVEPAQQLDQRALPGAVLADQRDRLPVGDRQADPAQRPRPTVSVPEPDVVQLDATSVQGCCRGGSRLPVGRRAGVPAWLGALSLQVAQHRPHGGRREAGAG